MADIDPSEDKKTVSPSGLGEQENSAAGSDDEYGDLEQRLGAIQDRVGEGGGGFYRDEGGKNPSGLKALGGASGAKGLLKNKKAMFGVGGGLLGGILVVGTIFNFLHTFQMDHFFKFMEQKTSQRLSASLDTRNKYLVKSYMRVRVTEVEGGTANDNLYFRANKVNGTWMDWYHTMRTSKFETDLLEKNGIVFTSMVDRDGKINIAKVTANGSQRRDLTAKYLENSDDGLGPIDLNNFAEKLNKIPDKEFEQMFTVDRLDGHKAARKSVREVVNKEVPWYRTFKRRHVRKDIANKTGIKSWRLFEKTRDKVGKTQQEIKDKLLGKIVDRYYSNNPASAQFMKCLFANGRCPSNSDPASPDSKTDSPQGGDLSQADDNTDIGSDGKPTTTKADTPQVGKDISSETKKVITNEVEGKADDVATQAAKLGPIEKITLALVRAATSGAVSDAIPLNPSKIWTWAKRIAKIDALLYASVEASKLASLVMNARSSQLQGIYATYQTANDQIKSGQLAGDELNSFFDTTKNIGNSEGWAVATNQMNPDGTVSAAAATNPKKDAYCKKPPSERSFDKFAYFCDDQRPNNGGNADAISNDYKSSVGTVLHPVADAVNTYQNSPFGQITNWVTGAIDTVMSKVLDPAVTALMGTTYGKDFGKFMGEMMMKLLGFLGAGPMFDGTQPGVGNLLAAGAASSFEDSTRASGGVAQTKITRAYTNEIAQNYNKEQRSQQSLVERYASLNNPQSLASSVAFSFSGNLSSNEIITKLASTIQSLPRLLGSVVTGRVFAVTQQNQSASFMSDWAGVNKYDIPQQCQDLDPLDPDYLAKSTNVQVIADISPAEIGMDNMRDTDKFWKKVYDKIGNGPEAQGKAELIYNCALFDARVMGSLGAVYGYDKDGGYDPTGTSNTSTTQTTTSTLGGLTFPLKTSKSSIINHQPAAWCYTCQTNQHHDYNAADIFADTGTLVVAPTGGQIIGINSASGGTGSHVIMKSDNGFIFYFTHMKEGSIKVSGGQTVAIGTELGEVGTDADAQGTASHLHFDAQPSPPATTRLACSSAGCAAPSFNFIDVQSALVAAFNSLPN